METPIRVGRDFAQAYPNASASATECAMNIARTGELVLGRVAAALQPLEVSPAGGLVLGILKDAGRPCPPNYISDRLIVSRATVTGVLDTLVKRGLVRREPHPTDRRMVLVHLTKAGARMADNVRHTVHRGEAEWMRSLSEKERAQLTDLLGKIQKHLAM
ncbi:MAG TPA: MarR family transcriptional regulator [Candidatus Micrarchaeaceae archaeon]|nr:MarR family transcriptional regulator [Candidatus Micrarchaeaceae archaeon]